MIFTFSLLFFQTRSKTFSLTNEKKPHFFNVTFQNPLGSADFNCTENGGIEVCTFGYPCESKSTTECAPYVLSFPPALIQFELYGASGWNEDHSLIPPRDPSNFNNCLISPEVIQKVKGNVECSGYCSTKACPGSGGYTSGWLSLHEQKTLAFLTVGGKGQNGKPGKTKGGFNGGGSSLPYDGATHISSGGGATDLRFDVNDPFHRVLVAGGGGGSDDMNSNDGNGGAGGGLTAQSFWWERQYIYPHLAASQNFGFSFYQGEAANILGSRNPNGIHQGSPDPDIPGGGGGWFGGFSSHWCNGGGGGGSSYALTKDSEIIQGEIPLYDEQYIEIDRQHYAFDNNSPYVMKNATLLTGVWQGNGMARITVILPKGSSPLNIKKRSLSKKLFLMHYITIILLSPI